VVSGKSIGGDEEGLGALVAMSHCKHFVVANSSLSWWAAWLSQQHWPISDEAIRPQRSIMAPSNLTFNTDFVPDWWERC